MATRVVPPQLHRIMLSVIYSRLQNRWLRKTERWCQGNKICGYPIPYNMTATGYTIHIPHTRHTIYLIGIFNAIGIVIPVLIQIQMPMGYILWWVSGMLWGIDIFMSMTPTMSLFSKKCQFLDKST